MGAGRKAAASIHEHLTTGERQQPSVQQAFARITVFS
jgi:hypothetical protein